METTIDLPEGLTEAQRFVITQPYDRPATEVVALAKKAKVHMGTSTVYGVRSKFKDLIANVHAISNHAGEPVGLKVETNGHPKKNGNGNGNGNGHTETGLALDVAAFLKDTPAPPPPPPAFRAPPTTPEPEEAFNWRSTIHETLVAANARERDYLTTLASITLGEKWLESKSPRDPQQVAFARRQLDFLRRLATREGEESKALRELARFASECHDKQNG